MLLGLLLPLFLGSVVDRPYSVGATAGTHVDARSSGVLELQCRLLAHIFVHHVDGHFYELVFRWYVLVIETETLGQLGGAGSRDALEHGLCLYW